MRPLLLAVLLTPLLALEPNRTLAADPPGPAQMRETLHQLELDLREARGLAAAVTDKGLRARFEQLIARMEQRREQLEKQLLGQHTEVVRRAIAEADFEKFLKALKGEAFDDRKGTMLRDFAKGSHFTSAQAATLVKQFSFSDGQVNAAVALHPRLVDPANFYEVLGVLTFDKDKDRVRKAIGSK